MKPHEERVVTEKQELDEKLTKLRAFILTPIFNALASEDRDLLEDQAAYMDHYSKILGRRIARFSEVKV